MHFSVPRRVPFNQCSSSAWLALHWNALRMLTWSVSMAHLGGSNSLNHFVLFHESTFLSSLDVACSWRADQMLALRSSAGLVFPQTSCVALCFAALRLLSEDDKSENTNALKSLIGLLLSLKFLAWVLRPSHHLLCCYSIWYNASFLACLLPCCLYLLTSIFILMVQLIFNLQGYHLYQNVFSLSFFYNLHIQQSL